MIENQSRNSVNFSRISVPFLRFAEMFNSAVITNGVPDETETCIECNFIGPL